MGSPAGGCVWCDRHAFPGSDLRPAFGFRREASQAGPPHQSSGSLRQRLRAAFGFTRSHLRAAQLRHRPDAHLVWRWPTLPSTPCVPFHPLWTDCGRHDAVPAELFQSRKLAKRANYGIHSPGPVYEPYSDFGPVPALPPRNAKLDYVRAQSPGPADARGGFGAGHASAHARYAD